VIRLRNNETSWVGFGNITIMAVILLFSAFIIPTAKADPPIQEKSCLSYGYAESGNHLFLIGENKTIFGNNLTFIHNCEFLRISVNGNFTAYSTNNQFTVPIELGSNQIKIESNESTLTYNNITVLPDRLSWEFEFYDWQNGYDFTIEEYITVSAATAQKNWASILSIVVVFSLVTQVYWHLINAYIDKNYFEEVVR
jgi:hypothetical protein